MVVPNIHYENAYLLPEDLCGELDNFSNKAVVVLREILSCEGVTIRQHNEPSGVQEVWHYHIQLLPRWPNDCLYQLHEERSTATADNRMIYDSKFRNYFSVGT
jgi:histidine triad (HIT) family protein